MHEWSFFLIESLVATYAVFTLALWFLWLKIPANSSTQRRLPPKISVIIPVRNESQHISALLKDLNHQTYDPHLFEVWIVDDDSSDNTACIVDTFIQNAFIPLKIIRLPNNPTLTSPKKRAIQAAITQATGELIVTTDGDCRVGPDWLISLADNYQHTQAKLISGPVTFTPEGTLTAHLQTVEFSSLIGSGAAAIAAGSPSLCNGANLAYEKKAFEEVGGFTGNEHLASGDDEFLMHKIAARYPGRVQFLKDPRSIVRTVPHSSWKGFYRQRKRWASKWKHYKNPVSIALALYVFACNATVIVALVLGLLGVLSWSQVFVILLTKWVPEWFFIGGVLSFLQKPKSLLYIPLVQLIYPFYVTFFGLVVQKPTYTWKGRRLS
jgi:cellulose synthase/poly-beta-1,6-N-acetylglucosamine synthase-like glycosyltransferase